MRGLAGRVIVAGGSATGIGAAAAHRLGEEGAKVVVGDINLEGAEETAASIRANGGEAVSLHYDQGDAESVAALVTQAVDRYGRLDGLLANAVDVRAARRDTDLLDIALEDWERTIRVGLTGYAYLIRSSLPHMLAAGGGAIVCTSSDASTIGEPVRPAYAVAKSGVNALVRHVASRWGKEGIRANAVCPFAMTKSVRESMDQSVLDQWLAAGRSTHLGTPEEMAGVISLLLSDDGSFVNGQVWSVNGGFALRG
jgi:NAD(P)-dependent dehydrogenase (short-subunit alcohol dehydrogenase family)